MSKSAVIAITSHVARGSVGGRASVFALERLGFPVWSLPTVLLPWHPGHGKGTRLVDAAGFASLAGDLARTPVLEEAGAVLSGYLGDAAQAAPIGALVAALKAFRPAAPYLCDPVIGDVGGLFVPEATATAVRDRLLRVADIATPNRHELEWLCGRRLADNAALVAAARALGPGEVLVTSAFAAPGEIGTLLVSAPDTVLARHRVVEGAPHGTGDLFAALYLGHRLNGLGAPDALQRAVASVLRLVEVAVAAGLDELPLAEGQDALVAPPRGVTLSAVAP
jgi:pyridoxine kinase